MSTTTATRVTQKRHQGRPSFALVLYYLLTRRHKLGYFAYSALDVSFEQPMSCYYRALPRIIPQLMLLARPGSKVVLASPWIENVTLYPPLFGQNDEGYPEMRLSEFLLRLARDHDIHITVIVRERNSRLETTIGPLLAVKPERLDIREVQYLHAKFLATEAFVLETSANIIWTSLFRNVESCRIVNNTYGDLKQLLSAKLNLAF